MKRRTKAQMLAAAVTLLGVLVAPNAWHAATTKADGSPKPLPASTRTEQLRVLESLPVAAERPMTGYSRKAVGPAWKDVDGNGCGQRDDVLARDLTDVEKRGRCVVVAGTLYDLYTARNIAFTKAQASKVQIDHVVPLAAAWRSGAATWTAGERTAFANDLTNLLAVDGPTNMAKGDSTPEDWMPANRTSACLYATIYVTVKAKYRLTATGPEKDSLRYTLTHAC